MGWFSKSKFKRNDDKVLVTNEWKIKTLIRDATELTHAGESVVVTCFFDDTFRQLSDELGKSGSPTLGSAMDFQRFADGYYSSKVLTGRWPEGGVPPAAQKAEKSFSILVAEHYPTPVRDEQIEEWAKSLGNAQLTFYESLDQGFISVLSGRITPLLEKMGIKENEVISHSFVSNAIRSAQKKIASRARADLSARNASDWLRANCPTFESELSGVF